MTNLNLNLNNAIIACFDGQHEHTLMSSRGANADKETARRLIFKELCSLGLVHVACEPTENKNDLMSRRAPTQEIRHIS